MSGRLMWLIPSRPLHHTSQLQEPAGVAVQELLRVLGRQWQGLDPFRAGRVVHERIVDRKQDAVDAISIVQHRSAGSEKKPLVVIQKCSQKTSRKVFSLMLCRSP